MSKKKIIIGTRGSKLALWQAHYTKDQLEQLGLEVELKIIKTKGDKIQHLSFDKIEGKGFFTKELEDALLGGEVDMAVHSMKDLPTTSPEGLVLAGVSYRANPVDCLVINKGQEDTTKTYQLKEKAVVGTSSARRKAQLLSIRPDVQLKDIRGNVPTRLRKLQEGNFDAILLAAAGLERLQLDLSDFVVLHLNPKEFVPAPAQGVLAYQTCTADKDTRRIIKRLHQPKVSTATNVERKILKLLEGGCQMPLGVYCEQDQMGHYVRYSSSTSFELAETVVGMLGNSKI